MASIDKKYHKILNNILKNGYTYEDPNRQGVKRKELLQITLHHNLLFDGFPALTTKKAYFKGAKGELEFFLSGSTDIRELWKKGIRFWDKDWKRFRKNETDYDMGFIYPKQYRNFGGVDQIKTLETNLKNNPLSTSLIVNAWNPPELPLMCLPPCHYGFQVVGRPLTLKEREQYYSNTTAEKYKGLDSKLEQWLDEKNVSKYGFEIHWQQRSTDFFLGTPVNIMYYALLAKHLEEVTGHVALGVRGDLKKVHLYENQTEAAKTQLKRDVNKYKNCKLVNGELEGYESYPELKVEMLTYGKSMI